MEAIELLQVILAEKKVSNIWKEILFFRKYSVFSLKAHITEFTQNFAKYLKRYHASSQTNTSFQF